MNTINLNSFLKLGYFLNYQNPNIKVDFSLIDKNKYKDLSENELIGLGKQLWKESIQKQFISNEKHVVPLSGGLDSRAILATLLEFTEARNIYTYTYGTPKTMDYEIGNSIAKIAGTNHSRFPLTEYKYSLREELDFAKRTDNQSILFLHPPVFEVDRLFAGNVIWSGVVIDVLFGRHQHQQKADNWEEAKRNSINENTFVNSMCLTNINDTEYFKYISIDKGNENCFPLEHTIDLMNRQIKYVAPQVLIKGHNYKLLLEEQLVGFALSLKPDLFENQYLYKKMFLSAFPDLFALPTKTNNGLSLNANKSMVLYKKIINKFKGGVNKVYPVFIDPKINYLDFDEAIRNKQDIKKIIYQSIMDLKQRKIVEWIDIDYIWKRHQNKQGNHADALIVLASLEIHLKAGKEI